MPSSSAVSARFAALAKSPMTLFMSCLSISFGQPLCIGSRIEVGAIVGSQSPSFETFLLPICVS